ncbi:MAG: helix-turn-helix domain-containing protein [Candidatus Tectomicrobia bacterium]|nr:helix-turn-helix domain-containing protein [Candidatus Tectomicrobia bacterium]
MRIDQKLKEIRKVLGISRKELSRLSGLSATTIYYFEKKNRIPSRKSLHRLIETLHLDEAKFEADIEMPHKPHSRKIAVEEGWLRHQYQDLGATASRIAQQCKISKSTILARLREYDIPRRPQFGHSGPQAPSSHPGVVAYLQKNRHRLTNLGDGLSPMEVHVLLHRLGLNGSLPRTLEEIGRSLRLTRERVRQIQNNALKKVSRAMSAHTASGRMWNTARRVSRNGDARRR